MLGRAAQDHLVTADTPEVGFKSGGGLVAVAQNIDQPGRIGVLMPFRRDDPIAQRFFYAFTRGLLELGWPEKSIAYEMRFSEGHPERLTHRPQNSLRQRFRFLLCMLRKLWMPHVMQPLPFLSLFQLSATCWAAATSRVWRDQAALSPE